jgi:hypothetical protein
VPDIEVVGLALSSLACLAVAVFVLVVRGAADWSRGFAVTWYGLFGGAVVLAIAAVAVAVRSRRVALKRRLTIVGLSLPALVGVPLLIWLIVTLAPLAN